MANVKIDKKYQYFLVFGMALMLFFSGFAAFKPVTVNTDSDAIAQAVAGAIVLPSSDSTVVESQLDAIYQEMFKEDRAEGVAEVLALDEIESKAFKSDLVDFLLDEIDELQDITYKDVDEISIRDVSVELDGDEAVVEVELKVTVSNFGDDDEQEKARVIVVFNIEKLDEDKEFEDADVESFGDFELVKFYD